MELFYLSWGGIDNKEKLKSSVVKAHFHLRKISTDRKFSENIIVKVENFQLQIFFPTESLCRPITFYKIFFPRKIFLSGNGPLGFIFYLRQFIQPQENWKIFQTILPN
jgi:hypothetical protein